MTPLHWFVNMNNCEEEQIQLLLDYGADITMKNDDGHTPFDMVSRIEERQHIADMVRIHPDL